MTRIPYWHVDAFSSRAFGGNQAAVMLLDTWLSDAELQAIAAENMFAATAFLVSAKEGDADWKLRWFGPMGEILLCGHATLAAAHVLLARDGGDAIAFGTRQSGVLEAHRTSEGIEIALPTIPIELSDHAEVISLLGAEPIESLGSALRHHVFLFENEAAIRALDPDFAGLARLGDDQFICTAPGNTTDIVSRVFVPGAGNNEDSVTGSAHAALTPFWTTRLGRESITAHQASARGGDLTCRMDGERVWLGGPCTTVVEGTFLLA